MDPTESNPTSVLLFDVYMQFAIAQTDRMFSAQLVNHLNGYGNWTWKQLLRGKPIDDRWLARKLSPYGIRPRNLRINGAQAKGYYEQDMIETVRRYPFLITPLTARAALSSTEARRAPNTGGRATTAVN